MNYTILNRNDLPRDGNSREFQRYLHGGTGISFIRVEAQPGEGPGLHKHPYTEVFIVQEGQAAYTVGATRVEVKTAIHLSAEGAPGFSFPSSFITGILSRYFGNTTSYLHNSAPFSLLAHVVS
jgi:quercetin dioxygenase-like cupin family protein